MGLFLVLFWCSAVAGDTLRYNSRLGVFNSRLGPNKFPFSRQRELAGKGLIYLVVLCVDAALFGNIRENSRFDGKNRETAQAALRVVARSFPTTPPISVAWRRSSEPIRPHLAHVFEPATSRRATRPQDLPR